MTILKKFLLSPVNSSVHYFFNCFTVCLYAFDTIQDVSANRKKQKWSKNRTTIFPYQQAQILPGNTTAAGENPYQKYFILPLVVWLLLLADYLQYSVFCSYLDDDADKRQSENRTKSCAANPALLSHRMYAPAVWEQGNMLVLSASSGFLFVSLALGIRKRWLNRRYCMAIVGEGRQGDRQLVVNGRAWAAKSGAAIIQFRAACRRYLRLLTAPSNAVGYFFFFYNFWQTPFNDLDHYLKLFVYLPVLTWYFIFSAAMMFFHFYVLTKYITFKQRYLLGQQQKLIRRIKAAIVGNAIAKLGPNWPQNVNDPQNLNFQRLYGAFHSIQAHFAYHSIFLRKSVEQFIYFLFYLLELGTFLSVVLTRASMVDMNNDYAFLKNLHIGVLFGLHARGRFTARQAVNMVTNQNFSRACFRLVNGYRVDSTAFQMAFFVIDTFFLMICQQSRRRAELNYTVY
ncbi:hypothetical protein TYRP_022511 [Tyrophagus putrescentiae]|nr:hypothetical protein TYRP_022511 [Tyrophagus putrescentiae]